MYVRLSLVTKKNSVVYKAFCQVVLVCRKLLQVQKKAISPAGHQQSHELALCLKKCSCSGAGEDFDPLLTLAHSVQQTPKCLQVVVRQGK